MYNKKSTLQWANGERVASLRSRARVLFFIRRRVSAEVVERIVERIVNRI
jgi:hypothetical protein